MKSKVSIVKCDGYEPGRVKEAVGKSLNLIGGFSSFFKRPCRVLIKPNLLSARLPEDAVNTHPEFVRAIVKLVRETGGDPAIGDSPGSFFTIKAIDDVYNISGMKKIADEEGVELVRFNKIEHINGYPIAKAVKEYDFIINVPKMKTHTLAMLTGAVKNTFGFVVGLSKVQCHKMAPHINEFSKILADIYAITRPHLSIMDGIVGMDGDGPAVGRIRKFGLILASSDAVSLDAVFSRIAGLEHSRNFVLKELAERGIGKGLLEEIEILGEDLSSAAIKDFRLPKTEFIYRFPSGIARHIAKVFYFKPVIDETVCKKCNICEKSCPVGAIIINKDMSRIDGSKCVKCFCCHEVCPHNAIYIKKNIFAKMLWR